MPDKQLIKDVIKDMIRDGEIKIKVSDTGDYYSSQREVNTVYDLECIIVNQMGFELEVDDE